MNTTDDGLSVSEAANQLLFLESRVVSNLPLDTSRHCKSAPNFSHWKTQKTSKEGRRRRTFLSEQKREFYLKMWMDDLRSKAYKSLANEDETTTTFYCNFADNCGRSIKGRGNLKRHLEWHLRKAEVENRQRLLEMSTI